MRIIALCILALTLSAEPAEARCPSLVLEHYVITAAPIHRDGAIVVGARLGRRRIGEARAGFPELSLRRGRVRVDLRLERLSPFLAIYQPTRRLGVGSYEVVGLGNDANAEIQVVDGHADAPTGPPPVRAVQAHTTPRRRSGRGRVHTTHVVFDALPPRAIAVHVSAAGQGIAGASIHRSYEVMVQRSGGRCGQSIGFPGSVGTEVEVRIIDADGQLGPPVSLVITRG